MSLRPLAAPMAVCALLLSFSRLQATENPPPETLHPEESKSAPLPGRLTSLTVDFPAAAKSKPVKADVAALLAAPISFKVKDASFLTAFDAVLSATDKPCRVECRGVKAMKLTFRAKELKAGDVLETLAKIGGGSLYVLPSKLLIAPPSLLTEAEQAESYAYSSLLTKATFPVNSQVKMDDKISKVLELANTKISLSASDSPLEKLTTDLGMAAGQAQMTGFKVEFRENHEEEGFVAPNFSFAMEDTKFGEVLSTLAHMMDCELYLVSDVFLIAPADKLSAEERKIAILASQPNSGADPSVTRS